MNIIPKIIHFIWIDFSNELNSNPKIPDKYINNINRTKDLNPDFTIKIWNGFDCDQLIKKFFPNKLDLYWSLEKPIMRCDFVRLVILYVYGGIYSDLDRISIRSYNIILQKYLEYDFIIGKVDYFGMNEFINDLMFAKPKSDFILECINGVKKNYIPIEFLNIFYTSGPNYIKGVFNNYNGPNKIISIYSEVNSCNTCTCKLTDLQNLVSYTTFDGSWNSKISILKSIEFIYCNIYKFIILILIGLIIFLKIK
jgi:mannosyltransferase OCH1-like enzyme